MQLLLAMSKKKKELDMTETPILSSNSLSWRLKSSSDHQGRIHKHDENEKLNRDI